MANPCSRIVLFAAVVLLMIPAALAVWDDSTGVVWVTQGEHLALGEHSVKVIDASIDEHVPFLEIKRKGNIIYKGFIEADKPVKVDHEIFVEYLGSSGRVRYGPQVKLRIYQWVDGQIVAARFPRFLNREARYNVWLEVLNTGVKDGVFSTELTQGGSYNARSGQYVLPDGTPTPIILDLAFPVQNVYIPSSSQQRVEYNDISGNRRQTSLLDDPQVRAGNSIEKNANVVFNLYFKGQLLDSAVIPNIGYGKTPSGYIQDVEFPDVMVQNQEYEAKAYVTSGDGASNTVDTAKLNLQLLTKGFTLGPSSNKLKKSPELQVSEDLIRKGLALGETDDWRFTITPNVPAGEYEVRFRLWQNRHNYLFATYDEFSKRVSVLSDPNRLIESVTLPPSVMVGERIPVTVRLNNVGVGKLLNVNIRAPTLLDAPVKRVVTVPTDSAMSLSYEIPAMVPGKAPLTVEVYPHKASNFKWNDPYSESGALMDSVTKTVEVLTGEEGPSLPPLPESELPPQRRLARSVEEQMQGTEPPLAWIPAQPATGQAGVAEGIVEAVIPPLPSEYDEVAPIPAPVEARQAPVSSWPQSQPVMQSEPAVIALIVLVLLVILLSLRVVINHHRRQARIAAHAAVERHLRKK